MADHESLLARALSLVPTHRQPPAPAQALAEALAGKLPSLSIAEAHAMQGRMASAWCLGKAFQWLG